MARYRTSVNYQMPRFGADGKEIEKPSIMHQSSQNILDEGIRIPNKWKQSALEGFANSRMTLRKLNEQRKSADLPHHSYDVDGDGFVSNLDYFLAKRFDVDKDGKLNEKELSAARQAKESGYLDQFMFGLERTGPTQSSCQVRPASTYHSSHGKLEKLPNNLRFLQREGKIIVAEDFRPLEGLKTQHRRSESALTSNVVNRTRAALAQSRKQQSAMELRTAYGELSNPFKGMDAHNLKLQNESQEQLDKLVKLTRQTHEQNATESRERKMPLAERLNDQERKASRMRQGLNEKSCDISQKINVLEQGDINLQ